MAVFENLKNYMPCHSDPAFYVSGEESQGIVAGNR